MKILRYLFLLGYIALPPCLPKVAFGDAVQIKVGATLPLTGRLSFAGEDVRRGIELAITDFSSPSVKLTAIYEDNQHDGKLAATTAHRLLDIDHVDALISMWDMADIVAPLTERKKVPHMAIRWNPQIAQNFSYTFTAESTYQSYVDSLLALVKSLGATTLGTLIEEGQGWILAGDYLRKVAPNSALRVVGEERFNPGDTEYRSVILRLLKDKPDMIVLLSNPPYTEQLVGQIKELAPTQRLTGYFEAIQDPHVVEAIPFAAQFQVADWFSQKFKDRFGEVPKSRAAQAYDIMKLLALSISKSPGTKPTPATITATLKANPGLSGAAGPLFVTGERSIESKCVWKIARNGAFTLYP